MTLAVNQMATTPHRRNNISLGGLWSRQDSQGHLSLLFPTRYNSEPLSKLRAARGELRKEGRGRETG